MNKKKYNHDVIPSIFDDITNHDVDGLDDIDEGEELKSITIKFARHDKKCDLKPWEIRSYMIISQLREERIYGKALKKMLYHELLESIGVSMENDGIIISSTLTNNIGHSVYCPVIISNRLMR